MTTRAHVVAEAREWIGTPYSHRQWIKGAAADCGGLIKGVALATGLYHEVDLPPYSANSNPEMMRGFLLRYLEPIGFKVLKPGDIVHFRVATEPTHLAIIVSEEPMFFLHAWNREPFNKVVETRLDKFWKAQIEACYRYRGLED